MMKLTPTLWRTCRVIACETRLKRLWHIFDAGEIHVEALANRTGISISNASNQLRHLSSRGLIAPRREKMRVFYRAEANESLEIAPTLLNAIRVCYSKKVTFKTMVRMATAFTHERRIEIVKALKGSSRDLYELQNMTAMSGPALSRHLDKLERRGVVKYRNRQFRLSTPGNALGCTLLKPAAA